MAGELEGRGGIPPAQMVDDLIQRASLVAGEAGL
jgi:hypothetical protein